MVGSVHNLAGPIINNAVVDLFGDLVGFLVPDHSDSLTRAENLYKLAFDIICAFISPDSFGIIMMYSYISTVLLYCYN
jgi:hypothetical protein